MVYYKMLHLLYLYRIFGGGNRILVGIQSPRPLVPNRKRSMLTLYATRSSPNEEGSPTAPQQQHPKKKDLKCRI